VALANYLAATGLPLDEAWPCAGLNALRALGLDSELGAVAPGYEADLVLLDDALSVVATLVAGEVVYLRDPERLTEA
jgi:N-acetylglucosamine-6-phosphate deacetylase